MATKKNAVYSEDCPDYLEKFLTHMRIVKDRSERTVEAYYIDLRSFLRYLKIENNVVDENQVRFDNITIADVPFEYVKDFDLMGAYNYLKWLAESRLNSAKTRARKTSALKQFYKYLADKAKLIPKDPVAQLELPRTGKTLPKYLSLEDAQKLLKNIDSDYYERDYCIITLFLNCGMRLSELCGIDLGDFSLKNGTLRLFGKGRKERVIYLNNACISALEDHLEIRRAVDTPDKALFLSKRNTRISKRRVQQIVENSLHQAGLDNLGITTHKLRHTAATLMYQHGNVDTLVLKDILGHESLATTEIYTHLSSENLRQAAQSNPLSHMAPEKKKHSGK